ncbi:MAG: MerR family transcriptional regulator [Candidatus Omnitrophota bacterium]
MKETPTTPLYTIGIVAKLLGVCPATLRIWERRGLIKPERLGKNRFYSRCDLERLNQIKDLIQKKKINIQGVKKILSTTNCWEIKKCKLRERNTCPVYKRYGHA